MNTKTFLKLTGAIALAACFSVPAHATLINGTIQFAGGVELTGSNPGDAVGSLDYFNSATGVHFTGGFVNPFVPSSGDYASVVALPTQTVTFNDFTYKPVLQVGGVNPLWTFTQGSDTYSFNLGSIVDAVSLDGGIPTLRLAGTGILNITGFDPTPGSWSLTTQATGGQSILSFSAGSASVPEPLSLSLLGIGIATLAAKRKALSGQS